MVGTGGVGHYGFGTPLANSEVRESATFGVLKLTLHATGYDWAFVPAAGGTHHGCGERDVPLAKRNAACGWSASGQPELTLQAFQVTRARLR